MAEMTKGKYQDLLCHMVSFMDGPTIALFHQTCSALQKKFDVYCALIALNEEAGDLTKEILSKMRRYRQGDITVGGRRLLCRIHDFSMNAHERLEKRISTLFANSVLYDEKLVLMCENVLKTAPSTYTWNVHGQTPAQPHAMYALSVTACAGWQRRRLQKGCMVPNVFAGRTPEDIYTNYWTNVSYWMGMSVSKLDCIANWMKYKKIALRKAREAKRAKAK